MKKVLPDFQEHVQVPNMIEREIHIKIEGDFILKNGSVYVRNLDTSEMPIDLWTEVLRGINEAVKNNL